MAMCNALGRDLALAWRRALVMSRGLRTPTARRGAPSESAPDANGFCPAALCGFTPSLQELGLRLQHRGSLPASSLYALHTALQAVEDSGLSRAGYEADKVGVFLCHDANLPPPFPPGAAENPLRRKYGFGGPGFPAAAACASGMAALYAALRLLRGGEIDAAVIGCGAQIPPPSLLTELQAVGLLAQPHAPASAPEDCGRPFDRERNGFVPGEGAAVLVLEREDAASGRGARIHGLISGMGHAHDAGDSLEPGADARVGAMRASFAALDYGPDAVQLVECCASGTARGDTEEGKALAEIYGRKGTVLSALMGQTGHVGGASGLMAVVHGLLCMRDGIFPGIANCPAPDPAIPLAEANLRLCPSPEPWPRPENGVRRVQINSFALGGSCFVLHAEEPHRRPSLRMTASAPESSVPPAPAISTPSDFAGHEDVVDGARLARLKHLGEEWRMGSVLPAWTQELAGLSAHPSAGELDALARRGVWLAPAGTEEIPPAAVMCCGQGSVWPGMGRALYDALPAARAAMDRIAAVAAWDVLGLMDEPELEKIILTRWQQPYLFLLEFAQASYLESLGFKPSVMSGHSLGELIALCLAGVYTPEQAWHILDTRARYTAELETRPGHDTGMIAVHGGAEVIDDVLRGFPDLRVSNYNTPTQHILSGPRDTLTEARRALRKNKIPAVLLNVSMAFHHPHMRALRETSLRELRAIPMRAPRLPMLSNVTTGLYPHDAHSICEYISDLDENAVRWVECVDNMWNIHKVRHFIELGPADTLGGLTSDIRPEAVCVSVSRKNREVESMRAAVARLYALGHLPRPRPAAARPRPEPAAPPVPAPDRPAFTPAHIEDVMPLIMEATGLRRNELEPDMDLRHDLSIRSSRFPLIMHAAEQRFSVSIHFEDLMGVATIRDLADALARLRHVPTETKPEGTPPAVPTAPPRKIPPPPRRVPDLRPLTDAPAPPAKAPEGPVLVVGAPDAVLPWEMELRRLGGDIMTAPDPQAALDLLERIGTAIPRGLVLALDDLSGPDGPDRPDPPKALACCRALLHAFARRKEAAFCVAAHTAPPDIPLAEALLAQPLAAGVSGLLSAAAPKYPHARFRAVLARKGAPPGWMARALAPGAAPVCWLIHSDGALSVPCLRPLPADPAARSLPLRPGDVVLVSGGRGIPARALENLAALGCALILLENGTELSPEDIRHLEALGAAVRRRRVDLTDAGVVEGAVKALTAEWGRVDGLIHVPGVPCPEWNGASDDVDHTANMATDAYRRLKAPLHAALPRGLRWAAALPCPTGRPDGLGAPDIDAADRTAAALLTKECRAAGIPWRTLWLPPLAEEDARPGDQGGGAGEDGISPAQWADALMRELWTGGGERDGHVFLTRPLAAEPLPGVRRGLAHRPDAFPLAYPLALEPGAPVILSAAHDFSHFHNPGLRRAPSAPAALLLACLEEAALLAAPWLRVVGVEEFRLEAPLLCPPGVTRDARLDICAGVWRMEEAPPPLCHEGIITARDVAANGRRLETRSRVGSARMLLAGREAPLHPLWEDAPLSCIYRSNLAQGKIAEWSEPGYRTCSRWLEIFLRTLGPLLAPRTESFPMGTESFDALRCIEAPPRGDVVLEARLAPAGQKENAPPALDAQALDENGVLLAVLRGLRLSRP